MYRKLILLIVIVIFISVLSINVRFETLDSEKTINIEIKGAVQEDKNLSLPLGSTISDALSLVQLKSNANISSLSLNEVLYNNEIIDIPIETDNTLISINSASLESLILLPGIGESIAQKIIDYREEYGSFSYLEEIMNVNGIGEKKYEKIKDYITL